MARRKSASARKVPTSTSHIRGKKGDAKKAPITIWVDPDMDGGRLTRDLSMVGLRIGTDEDGCVRLVREGEGWANRLPVDARRQVMYGLLGLLDDVRAAAKLPAIDRREEAPGSIEERIEDQRNELFGAMAVIAVARDSVTMEANCDLHRALADAYKWVDRVALTLNEISTDAKQGVANA